MMIVVGHKEVCELFQTQTQCLNVYPDLYDQTLPTFPQFYYNFMFYDKSFKTVAMITLY